MVICERSAVDEMEHAVRSGGIEVGAMAEGGFELFGGFLEFLDEPFGVRCRLHSAGGADEQGIVEVAAETREAHADGGLAQAQILSCVRHVGRAL